MNNTFNDKLKESIRSSIVRASSAGIADYKTFLTEGGYNSYHQYPHNFKAFAAVLNHLTTVALAKLPFGFSEDMTEVGTYRLNLHNILVKVAVGLYEAIKQDNLNAFYCTVLELESNDATRKLVVNIVEELEGCSIYDKRPLTVKQMQHVAGLFDMFKQLTYLQFKQVYGFADIPGFMDSEACKEAASKMNIAIVLSDIDARDVMPEDDIAEFPLMYPPLHSALCGSVEDTPLYKARKLHKDWLLSLTEQLRIEKQLKADKQNKTGLLAKLWVWIVKKIGRE